MAGLPASRDHGDARRSLAAKTRIDSGGSFLLLVSGRIAEDSCSEAQRRSCCFLVFCHFVEKLESASLG